MRQTIVQWFSDSGLPGWLVPDYWFMLVLAIIVGSLLTLFLWRRSGYPVRTASDLLFWGILLLFVGSKYLYYLQYDFLTCPQERVHSLS